MFVTQSTAKSKLARSLSGLAAVLIFLATGSLVAETGVPKPEATLKAAQTVTLSVEGMTCASCVGHIRKTVSAIDGVREVKVSLEKRNAEITFDPSKTSAEKLVSAINGLGYKAKVKGAP